MSSYHLKYSVAGQRKIDLPRTAKRPRRRPRLATDRKRETEAVCNARFLFFICYILFQYYRLINFKNVYDHSLSLSLSAQILGTYRVRSRIIR